MNKLLSEFTTPHQTYPFSEISVQDIKDAIGIGIETEKEEIAQIVSNAASPTFENTIVALEKSGRLLARAVTLMYNLLSAETSDELEELSQEVAPVLSKHDSGIMQDVRLFERVQAVYDSECKCHNLHGEDFMLLTNTYDAFKRAGATLKDCEKARLSEIKSKLSELKLRFSQNLLRDTNAFELHITDEHGISGLPDIHKQAAAEEAGSRQKEGWVFTLNSPSFVPFMSYVENRSLRERMYMAYNSRCTHDNAANNISIVREIVNLRQEMAQLLGYSNYADFTLCKRMAASSQHVSGLLSDLLQNYSPRAHDDFRQIETYAQGMEGVDFKLEPWDYSFYSHKYKKELYDYDPNELRPYFELSNVVKGVLGLATRLYGITFVPNKEIPTYHDDVTAYEVYDEDGSFLAVVYTDFFPRKGKQGGAWMTNYREERSGVDKDTSVTALNSERPHVSIVTNFTKPTADLPALLSFEEVETLLHEFGHALHGIFAMTRYAALSGTSVYWDFVELPSQIMENYAYESDFLSTFAKHYSTGEQIPQKYIEQVRNNRNFQVGYFCLRQISFGLLDMAFHTLMEPFKGDIFDFEMKAMKQALLLPMIPGTCMSTQFGHIMSGGYAAGYYSYKWAEVLEADAFQLFKENGIFSKVIAQRFRDNILSRGGTVLPMRAFVDFRKAQPTLDALLERDGIKR